MAWQPAKEAVGRLWARRWIRRVSYTLVAGTTALTLGPWMLTRPAVMQWGIRRLDLLVREETGLALVIGHIELHPFLGSFVLHDLHLGGDLLTIERIEVVGDPWSMFNPTHHLASIRVIRPTLRLTEEGISALRLKPHPRRQGPLPQFRLDLVTLTEGRVEVPVPFRGIPPLRVQFDLKGTGHGTNHLQVALPAGQVAIHGPSGWEKGRMDLNADLTESGVSIHEAYLRITESQVRISGRYEFAGAGHTDHLDTHLAGIISLAQAAHWAGAHRPPLAGNVGLSGSLKGTTSHPIWTLDAEGQDLRPALSDLRPGDLQLTSHGTATAVQVDHLQWLSPQGKITIQGRASSQEPTRVQLLAAHLDLGTLGRVLRLTELQGVRGQLQGHFQGPALAHSPERPNQWTGSLKGSFDQGGRPAGGLQATLAKGRLGVSALNLTLDSLGLDGSGWVSFGSREVLRVEGEGNAQLGLAQVAKALQAWRIVDLDMDGQASASARVHWTPRGGLGLDGGVKVLQPRWHGAQADSLSAQVEIRASELKVTNLRLDKDQGYGAGDLWLTWAPTRPGERQLDMCYTAFRLPVTEGLKAADRGDLPLQGQATGWTRIHGPYDHLLLEGAVQVEEGQAYGLKLPVSASDFLLDLRSMRLQLEDLRVAGEARLLGQGDLAPEGDLALRGRADLDLNRWTWWMDLRGQVDTQALALPGPRIQARLETRLLGPITAPFGRLDLPEGTVHLDHGRIFFGDRSVEGLDARLSLERGVLQGRLSMDGYGKPVLDLRANQKGLTLEGDVQLEVSNETTRSSDLVPSLTKDFLQDLTFKAGAHGTWDGQALAWKGSLETFAARFHAFELHQIEPSPIRGNGQGALVDLTLEGGGIGVAAGSPQEMAQVHLSGSVPFLPGSPVAIRGQGGISLTHLKSVLDRVMEVDEYSVLSELSLQGQSRFDILAHGTYAEPLLDGTLSLSHGKVNLLGYQGAEDLTAEIQLKNRTLLIPEENPIRGTLAHGDLQLSGLMAWKLGGIDTYNLKASLQGFQLRDVPAGLDLQGSLEATLTGQEGMGLLKGTLQADHLTYQTEVKLSDLILRSALNDSGGLTGLDPDDPLDSIHLALDLNLREPWRFDTNLLKLEGRIEGPFQILGTLGHPVPKGTLVFQPGGRVTNIFPAGDMVVDRGSLTFSELRPLDPIIAMQGSVSSIPGYTVNMDIHGTLSNLSIVPSSTPSLRQDEIVAILINPGNVANVGMGGASSSTQGAITSGLASASSGLLTTLAFTPFQEQLRRTLGLDRVNVALRTTSLGTTETEFTVGKSINLFGQRSAFVISHKKSGELAITSGQVEWRFGNLILQLGASKGGSEGLLPSGEIRHTWSPR